MRFHPLSIPGAFRIEIKPEGDECGFFAAPFAQNRSAGTRWDDPTLAKAWPIADSIVSAALPLLREGSPAGPRQ